jgi:hypothetical protein
VQCRATLPIVSNAAPSPHQASPSEEQHSSGSPICGAVSELGNLWEVPMEGSHKFIKTKFIMICTLLQVLLEYLRLGGSDGRGM